MLKNYLRLACRNLLAHKRYSTIKTGDKTTVFLTQLMCAIRPVKTVVCPLILHCEESG